MSMAGKLLIAHPNLPAGSPWAKTVIYVYEDKPTIGTLGLVLNKFSNFTVRELCHQKGIMFPDSAPVIHKGGPVNEQALMLLHTDEWQSQNTTPAGKSYRISSDNFMFEKIAKGDYPAYYRFFAGMAAWSPGQLNMELKGQFPFRSENSWLTADSNDSILFEYDGEKQWERAIATASSQMIDQFF
jgi:putative AlgH/UPF0301 family transcriptional regulator